MGYMETRTLNKQTCVQQFKGPTREYTKTDRPGEVITITEEQTREPTITIIETQVEEVTRKLKKRKVSGKENSNNELVKYGKTQCKIDPTKLCKIIIEKGVVPKSCNTSITVPILNRRRATPKKLQRETIARNIEFTS